MGYRAYREWTEAKKASGNGPEPVTGTEDPPLNQLKAVYAEMDRELCADLLDKIRNHITPEGFEQVVVDLIKAMGYGEGDPTGKPGDHGIDGVVHEDTLGLDKVYIQAKKYAAANKVSESDIRGFAGSMIGTDKGVFVTTSSFTASAHHFARISPKQIVLIDGAELARLMAVHGVGVRTADRLDIREIDEAYFGEYL